MSRVYICDAPAISHWKWHSSEVDEFGNETSLAARVTAWWSEFQENLNPSHFVCTFDGKGSWRKELMPEYKSARLAKPVEPGKLEALATMPDLWRSLGVQVVSADTFESDDLIATLTARFSEEAEVVVITSDKDLTALVGEFPNNSARIYDPRPDKNGECKFFDEEAVYQKFGVRPHRMQEYLAIVGDASDSVPGVPGWGRVNAINAIRQTKTASEIFRKAAKHELQAITTKNQDKLVAGRADFDLSLRLVSLRYDVPVTLTLEDCEIESDEWLATPLAEVSNG